MFNWFNLLLALIIGGVVVFIIKAVKQTKSEMDKRFNGLSKEERNKKAKQLAQQIRAQEVRCPRCSGQTFAMLGTSAMYKCHSCNFEFEGPEHPGPDRNP